MSADRNSKYENLVAVDRLKKNLISILKLVGLEESCHLMIKEFLLVQMMHLQERHMDRIKR